MENDFDMDVHVVWCEDRHDPEWGRAHIQAVYPTRDQALAVMAQFKGAFVSSFDDFLENELGKAHQRGIWTCVESHE